MQGFEEGTAAKAASGNNTYSCKRCRTLLFTSSHVIPHDPSEGRSGHKPFKHKAYGIHNSFSACTSMFVNYDEDEVILSWMRGAVLEASKVGSLQGDLFCPKCPKGAVKLGRFNIGGSQCSCGHWVVPAYQITFSKVDEVPMHLMT
eukprot:PhM_4_TR14434/c0_g3_i1/m.76840/K14819/DUSP12, YVH1; dual specificity phosphatase 12